MGTERKYDDEFKKQADKLAKKIDITKVKADIIVNTANPRPVVGSGTDSAI